MDSPLKDLEDDFKRQHKSLKQNKRLLQNKKIGNDKSGKDTSLGDIQ